MCLASARRVGKGGRAADNALLDLQRINRAFFLSRKYVEIFKTDPRKGGWTLIVTVSPFPPWCRYFFSSRKCPLIIRGRRYRLLPAKILFYPFFLRRFLGEQENKNTRNCSFQAPVKHRVWVTTDTACRMNDLSVSQSMTAEVVQQSLYHFDNIFLPLLQQRVKTDTITNWVMCWMSSIEKLSLALLLLLLLLFPVVFLYYYYSVFIITNRTLHLS